MLRKCLPSLAQSRFLQPILRAGICLAVHVTALLSIGICQSDVHVPNVDLQTNAAATIEMEAADRLPFETSEQATVGDGSYDNESYNGRPFSNELQSQQLDPLSGTEQTCASCTAPTQSADCGCDQGRGVRNHHLFGDPDACCDEWSGFCRMKDLSYDCGCGGLKAKRGHLGLSCLRSADAGEDCDYCNGGCCSKSGSAIKERKKTRRSVFTDAIRKAYRLRGDCAADQECGCSEDEPCSSCR